MNGALAVAAAEVRTHRIALLAGLAFGVMTAILVALFGGLDDDLEFVATVVAVQTAAGIALGLGASVVSRDLSERRLGFYLSRPLPPPAYWAGKMAAALFLAIASGALSVVPVLVLVSLSGQNAGGLSWSSAAAAATYSFMPYVGLTFVLAAAAAAGGAARSRSRLLILDIVMVPLTIVLYLRAIGASWRAGTSDIVIPQALSYVLIGATLAVLLGGLAQVSLGRLDFGRGHAWLSAIAWSGVLACIGGIHLFSNAVASAAPGELRLSRNSVVALHPAPTGDHAMLEGAIRHRPKGFYPGFLLDQRGQYSRMGGLDGLTGFAWSPDGRRFAWSKDSLMGGGSSGYSGPEPLRTRIPGFGQSHWIVDFAATGATRRELVRHEVGVEAVRAFSPSGGRVLLATRTSKLIVDASTGGTLASIPESPAWSQPRFLSETLVRALRVGHDGQHRVVEWDSASGRLSERGAITLRPRDESGRSWLASLTPTDDFELVLRCDSTGLSLHDLDGGVVAKLVDGWRTSIRFAGLLSGRRAASIESDPREGLQLRVFGLDGRPLLDARLPEHHLLRVGGESAPGLLALGVAPVRETDGNETVFVDVVTGSMVRREPGLTPALRRWSSPHLLGPRNAARGEEAMEEQVPNPVPGSFATRAFFGDEGLVLLDSPGGARRVIVRRRDEN